MSVLINNDSRYPYICRFILEPDPPSHRWRDMASTVVAGVTASLAVSPALQFGVIPGTNPGAFQVWDVPAKFLIKENVPLPHGVFSTNSGSQFGAALSAGVVKYLLDHSYHVMMPGEKRYTTATNVNQKLHVDCKIVSTDADHGSQVTMETKWKDVETSDSTDKKKEYLMSKWLDKSGVLEEIEGTPKKRVRT